MLKRLIYIFFISSLLIFGCKKSVEDSDSGTVFIALGRIDSIEIPDSLLFGQSDSIVVHFWGGTDGCAKPDHLHFTETDSNILIKAYYNYPMGWPYCLDYVPHHRLARPIKPKQKGTHVFKSFNSNVSATLVVY